MKDDEELTKLKLLNEDEEDSSSPTAAHLCDVQQLRQIQTDLARTKPDDFTRLFSDKKVQFVLTRVLYTWAIRNPGAGYVQGLNDILVPFFIVFLLGSVENPELVRNFPETIAIRTLLDAEADSSAGFQALVSEIQDFYTSSQPGITIQLDRLKAMVKRIRPDILRHFDEEAVDISHFAFRWFNCLLTREFRTACVLQLWDTLLAEGLTQIKAFLQYLCTAYLLALAEPLVHKNFQDVGRQLPCFLHVPPGNYVSAITALPTVEPGSTQNPCCTSVSKQAYGGGCLSIKLIVRSVRYVLKSLFEDSPNQLLG